MYKLYTQSWFTLPETVIKTFKTLAIQTSCDLNDCYKNSPLNGRG